MTEPDVAVVIPALNEASRITNQLKALEAQESAYAFEVIVADNGSTDNTRSVVEGFHPSQFDLRLIDASRRRGINHARNCGVRATCAPLILLCDADDEVESRWLTSLTTALLEADTVGGRLVFIDAVNGRRTERGPGNHYDFLLSPSGSNCGFSRAVFDEVGGFDEMFAGGCDDTDFFWRVQLNGGTFAGVEHARILKTPRGTARSVFRQQYLRGTQQPQLFKKHRAAGMRRRPLRRMVGSWTYLALDVALSPFRTTARRRLPSLAGKCCGRLVGSVKHRVLFL